MEISKIETPPNGVLIYLDEKGQWVISANRFLTKVLDQELYETMFEQARQFLREARDEGHEGLVDPEDDDAIAERLPNIGESIPGMENVNRVVESLDEAASVIPKLWAWIVGLDEEVPAEVQSLREP
jgi:hypothetical protein